jgi:hypothetical protein
LDVPLPSDDANEAIESTRAILRAMKAFESDAIVDLMRSPYPEVKGAICDFLLDNEEFARSVDQYWCVVYKICRQFLFEAVRDDAWNLERLTRIDAAEYVGRLFWHVWKTRPPRADVVLEMRDDLAAACRSTDARHVDTVVLGLLEHMFQDKQIVAFFSIWRDDPTLAKVFEEACSLAKGFDEINQLARCSKSRRVGKRGIRGARKAADED